MKKRLLIITVFVFYSTLLFAEFSNMHEALKGLASDNQSLKEKSIDYFLAREKESLPYLHNYFFPDYEQLLKNLGDEEYQEREKATKFLSTFGKDKKEEILKLSKETRDPEVRQRCKTVLNALKNKKDGKLNDLDQQMDTAVVVFIKADSTPEISHPFIKRYFVRYKELSEEQKKHLHEAIKKVVMIPDMVEDVVNIMEFAENQEDFDKIAEAVKEMSPGNSKELVKIGRRKFLKRYLDIEKYKNMLDQRTSGSSSSNMDYEMVAKAISENEKDFEIKKEAIAEKLMDESSYKYKALGAFLIKENPALFKKKVVEIIKTLNNQHSSYFMWAVKRFANKEELFKDQIEEFLDSSCYEVARLGMDMIKNNPEPYKEQLIKSLLDPKKSSYSMNYARFIKKHFPEEKKEIIGIMVESLLESEDQNLIRSISSNLSKSFDYKGNDFDEWWKNLASDPEKFKKLQWTLMWAAPELNVKPETVIPFLNKETYLSGEIVKHLMRCKDSELKQKLMDFLMDYLKRKKDSRIGVSIVNSAPELSSIIIPFILKEQEKDKKYKFEDHGFFSNIPDIGKKIADYPDAIKQISFFLKSQKTCVRFHAAMLLKEAGKKKDIWLKTITNLDPKKINGSLGEEVVPILLANKVPSKKVLPFIKSLIYSKEKYLTNISDIMRFFDERNQEYLPGFEDLIENYSNREKSKDINQRFIYLAEAMLYIDKDNLQAIKFLKKAAIESSDYEFALNALEVLGKFEKDPVLSEERLEELYTKVEGVYSANEAFQVSKANAKTVAKIIKKHIKLNLSNSYSGIDDVLSGNEEIQKELTPTFIELMKSDSPGERDFSVTVMSGNTEQLLQYMKDLHEIWVKLTNPDTKDTFLWMLANIGQPAKGFLKIIKDNYSQAKGERKYYYYFTMARIHPDKKIRRKFTQEFLEYIKKNGVDENCKGYRMLGLIKEFPEITHPFLKEKLFVKGYESRSETAWALARVTPFTEYAKNAFRERIKMALEGDLEYFDTILGIISSHPEEFPDCLETLDKLPVEIRFKRSWWWFRDARKALLLQKKLKN